VLHDLSSRLTALLERVLFQLGKLDDYAAHWSSNDEGVIRLSDKFVTEAALLLLLSRRAEPVADALTDPNDRLADRLGPLIRNERLRGMLITTPQSAATLGAGHIFLTVSGNADPHFEALVKSALDDGFGETVERVPYRQLDQRWTRNLQRHDALPVDDLLSHSILNSRAHPFYMTQGDAYAVTHAVMYATDFGRNALPLSLDRNRVHDMILSGLAWHIVSQDFDLLIEYLMCAECVGLRDSAHAQFGWHVVRRLWDQIGFVPGPTFDAAHFRTLQGVRQDSYAVEHMYHTNFVLAMYCAVRLAMGGASVAETFAADDDRDEIELLLGAALSIEGTRSCPEAPWFAALDDAPIPDPLLVPVLWGAIAIEAVRRADWRAVSQLDGMRPASAQASTLSELNKLLDRISAFKHEGLDGSRIQ
jgi:hypothetical protein